MPVDDLGCVLVALISGMTLERLLHDNYLLEVLHPETIVGQHEKDNIGALVRDPW